MFSPWAVRRRCAQDAGASDPGTTVKPLDGAFRWTRAPVRGLAVAPLARLPPAAAHSRARVGRRRRREIEGERMELGFSRASARGFLIGRNPRAAVDLDRTVAVEPRLIGLL
jgi:hypothetical protein